MKTTVIYCLLTLTSVPCAAVSAGTNALDMISISADEASEDEKPGVFYFSGHFRMQSEDWFLTSTEATVYGNPEKPDRVYLEGSPARFLINRAQASRPDQIEAAAKEVEYLRSSSLLVLSGEATLKLGKEIIRSTHIEFDIDANRYRAGGADGVHIEVEPTD